MLLRPVLMPILRNPLQGIADGIRNMLAELLGSSQFFAPLTHSLVLARGTGSPTFTRASTATFTDWEGVLRTVPSGCARFEGARMVRNLLTFTEDFSNAAWTKSVTTVSADSTIAPDGTASADLVTADVGTSEKYIGQNATSASPSVISIYAKQGTHGLIQILNGGGASFFANFDLSSGVVGNVGVASVAEISNAGNGWYRCSVKFAGAINNGWFVCVCDNIGNGYYPNISTTGNFYLWGAQLEDVTGQADQTTPSEYVSVGATPINYITYSQDLSNAQWVKSAVAPTVTSDGTKGPDGVTPAYLVTGLVSTKFIYNQILAGLPATTRIEPSFAIKRVSTTGTFTVTNPSGANGSWTINLALIEDGWVRITRSHAAVTINSEFQSNGAAGGIEFDGTATSTTFYLTDVQQQAGTVSTTFIPTTTVAKAYNEYHGAGVDGVEYFNTDLTGAAIPAAPNLGYLAEAAATQLLPTADIRDMTTAGWTLGATMTRARTSVGADGAANSATRLTGGAVAATNTCYTTIVAAASSRTYSALVKRVTGTGPVRIVQTGTETDISSLINSSTYTLVQLNASILNAVMGFKIDTNGDAIDVDFNQFEAGTAATSRMVTTGAARNADVLTYPSAGNISGTAGWCSAEFSSLTTAGAPRVIGDGVANGNGALILGIGPSQLKFYDGTNYNTGPAAVRPISSMVKGAVSWGGSTGQVALSGTATAATAFDGDMSLGATLSIGTDNGTNPLGGTTRNLRIGQRQLSSSELQAITR